MPEAVRLGGMALENGVLVHGPRHWACAIRADDGSVQLASGRKPIRAAEVQQPLLRGPLRLAEVVALLPAVRAALPQARLPYGRPRVLAGLAGSALASRALRRSPLGAVAQEGVSALLALGPALLALRGSTLAEYHGAEHISIGSYEHGEERPREHERCGSHLVGPLVVTTAAGSLAARLAPPPARLAARAGAALGAVAASVELFGWMVRNEEHPLARALARPGTELQHRVLTAEPSGAQLEVAEAALAECLRLESPGDGGEGRTAGDGEEAPPT
ncbi:MAG: DUF1385 domain-containing protein [Thermoleophilia bacterium]|nr:DUF1385 domain-containing protein [Thermoleophilia bacterium]